MVARNTRANLASSRAAGATSSSDTSEEGGANDANNSGKPTVSLLDYGAGNVRSVRNALQALGYPVVDIASAEAIAAAEILVFPGVGSFGEAMRVLDARGFTEPLKAYIAADRPFFGVCLGMQTLFESSEGSPGVAGLGVIPGAVRRFAPRPGFPVPHIGWNDVARAPAGAQARRAGPP